MDPNVQFLTPDILKRMRAVQPTFPSSSVDADGNECKSYRIWQSVGKKREDNIQSRVIGSLTLKREEADASSFRLKVHYQVLMIHTPKGPYKGLHEITAELECTKDILATPQSWRVENRFHRDGEVLEDLTTTNTGTFQNSQIQSAINGSAKSIEIKEPWTADWCLFEAAPRMLASQQDEIAFTQVGRMRDVLPDQRLFRYSEADYSSDHFGAMRCMTQTGYGILPCDYWFNEAGELLFMTNLHTAYILDDEAEAKIERILRDRFLMRFEEEEVKS